MLDLLSRLHGEFKARKTPVHGNLALVPSPLAGSLVRTLTWICSISVSLIRLPTGVLAQMTRLQLTQCPIWTSRLQILRNRKERIWLTNTGLRLSSQALRGL